MEDSTKKQSMNKKEYKALIEKHKFFFSKDFTPGWLIDNGIVTMEEFEDIIHIIIDPEDPQDPFFKYRQYFDTDFYKKVNEFLQTKDCEEFTFEFPEWIEDVRPNLRPEAALVSQIIPSLNRTASWL